VLLTGGAGFIGSHVAEALLRRGAQLAILDNLDDFYPRPWKQASLEDLRAIGPFEFFQADVCDPAGVNAAFEKTQPEIVIHLAARAGVRPSIENPLLYERVNVGGTAALLEACRQFRARKLIFGSSSSVYGATSRAPFSEDQHDLRPISPYAATKLAGELAAYTYAHLYRLPVVCLRFFTVYGPRQRPDLAIHKFTALVEAGMPVPVFGDGSTGRDYTWVDDIVAGVLAAMDYSPAGEVPFEVFNLGNSSPVRLEELLATLERATGREVRRQTLPAQPGDVPLTWADISKACRLLGYNPQTQLDEGLARFVEWYRRAKGRRYEPR
jgi:UDP-glucuronate 4-epimerase